MSRPVVSYVVHHASGPGDTDVLATIPSTAAREHEVVVVAPGGRVGILQRLLGRAPAAVVGDLDEALAAAVGDLVWFVDARATVDREAWARCLRRFEEDDTVVHVQSAYATDDGEVRSVRGLLATDRAVGAPVFGLARRDALLAALPAVDGDALLAWCATVAGPAATVGRVQRSHPVELAVGRGTGPLPVLARVARGETVPVHDRPTVGWIGFHGHANLGDEAVLVAAQRLLPGVDVVTDVAGTHGTVLGGGTLLNTKRYFQRQADELDAPGLARLVLGTGVVSPTLRGFTEDLERWRPFLDAGPVGLRGPDSVASLRAWGWDGPVEVVGDPALVLEAPGGSSSGGGGVVLAPVAASEVGQVEEADERHQAALLASSASAWRAAGHAVTVLLAHPDDRRAADRLLAAGLEAEVVEGWDDLDRVLALLAGADLVVGTRLHAIVLAAAVATPFVGLAYRPKLVDFARSVGADEVVRPVAAWSPEELVAAGERATGLLDEVGAAVATHRTALRGRAEVFTAAVAAVEAAGPWTPDR